MSIMIKLTNPRGTRYHDGRVLYNFTKEFDMMVHKGYTMLVLEFSNGIAVAPVIDFLMLRLAPTDCKLLYIIKPKLK